MKTARVLVTSAGGIVSQGIIKSLKLANENSSTSAIRYSITAADASPLAAGLYRCDKGELVPLATSANYIDAIINICNKGAIDAIFVGSDDELQVLANAREKIETESRATLLSASSSVLAIARDKWKTYQFCTSMRINCAPTCLPDQSDTFVKEFGFPLVVKPREGYGSKHLYIVDNKEELDHAISTILRVGWQPIIQMYVEGDEFTSGVTVDKRGKYSMSSISIRKLLKDGQTHKAFIDDYPIVRKSAEDTALKLGIRGPVNVQVRLHRSEPMLIEINPRFSATCPMRAVAGVNEPDIVYRNAVLDEDIKVDRYQHLVCLRYLNEVYVSEESFKSLSRTGAYDSKVNGSFIPQYF